MSDRNALRGVVAAALLLLACLPAQAQIKQFLGGGRDARVVMVLVDLNDSVKGPPSDAVIAQRRAKGLLPDLHGVQVFVAGASAGTSDRYVEVQDFWLNYLHTAGAQISAKTYGRVALAFE